MKSPAHKAAFGQRLRQAMKARGMTQMELSGILEDLGCSVAQGRISQYCTGVHYPSTEKIREALARALAVPMYELFPEDQTASSFPEIWKRFEAEAAESGLHVPAELRRTLMLLDPGSSSDGRRLMPTVAMYKAIVAVAQNLAAVAEE